MGWVEGGGEEKWWMGWVGGGGEEIIPITFRKYCYIHNYSLNLHSVNFSSLVHVQLIS